jgi:hypothetical protein
MSDCCDSSLREASCPVDGHHSQSVGVKTILHHLKQPWLDPLTEQHYYFCDNPSCDVIYFGQDGCTIKQSQLRTVVGIKTALEHAPLCYCFGVSKCDAKADLTIRSFVIEQTKKGVCTCTTHNPSGRCCLKDFPKPS